MAYELHEVIWLICFINLPWPHSSLLGDIYRNGNQPEHRNSKQLETEAWKVEQCGSVKCQKSIAIHLILCKIMSTYKSQQKIIEPQDFIKKLI